MSTSLSTYAVGSSVVVNFDAMSGAASDWVAISEVGTADDKFVKWQYTAGEAAGSRTFTGLPGGSYEARAYFDWAGTASYAVQYRSSFTIAGTGAPVLTPPINVAMNAAIQIGYSGLPGNRTDWIAVAAAGSPASSFLRWGYTGGATSGTTNFAGLPAGNYVARAFYDYQNTSSLTVQAEAPFTVAGVGGTPTLTLPSRPTSATPIDVAFASFPGYATDWVAVAVAGSPDTAFVRWKYTNGALTGTVALGTLADGDYEARGYANWAGTSSYAVIARQAFTVGGIPVADAGTDAGSGTATLAYTGAMTTFTVPNGVGSLRIQAFGAQGGSSTTAGGLGAEMAGTFAVTPGQQLQVLVGQRPPTGNGGGGGTFVVDAISGNPLIVAGGGGGGAGNCCGGQVPGAPGVTAPVGTAGTSPGCTGGSGGVGGGADQGTATTSPGSYGSGAGAGFVHNGQNGASSGVAGLGGKSFRNGGAAGAGDTPGGFGGGGGSSNVGYVNGAGGGGGGYAGGGGSCGWHQWGSGGGGGSFNGGTSQTNASGTRSGNGQVILTW